MLEYIEFIVRGLQRTRSRTFLTLLGIIIGIAVIVAMVSITQGMKSTMEGQLAKLGGDKITVMSAGIFGAGFGPPQEFVPFEESQLREIERIPGVKRVAPYLVKIAKVEFRGEETETYIYGATEDGIDMYREFLSIKTGREIKEGEKGVVNIGAWVAKNMFDNEVHVGDTLTIKGEKFKVVGIYNEIGNRDDDSTITMSMESAQELFDSDEISYISVEAESEEVVGELSKKIEDRLKKMRGGKDFEVLTTKQLVERIAVVLDIVEFVLAGIASISLIVGGVIVMNTMLVSVLERTREIGVMKATGATVNWILGIFLLESGLMGLIGGGLGVIIGTIIAKVIEMIGQKHIGSMFITVVSGKLVLAALLLSLSLGILSGIYPAWRAAKLDPVEALRYE
jgi:putative ABC transport system permease protein